MGVAKLAILSVLSHYRTIRIDSSILVQNMTRLLFLALIIALISPQAALAAEVKSHIRPVMGPEGKLAFCVAEQKYDRGLYLSIGYSPKENLYISATIPKAGFKAEKRYDIKLMLDNNFKRKVRAIATSSDTLLIDMGRRAGVRRALVASTTLKLGANRTVIPFQLPNMMRVFTALKKCAENEGKEMQTNLAPTVQEPGDTTFPPTLMALLTKAGFDNITPLSMDDIPANKRPADYIWKTGELLAGVRSRKVPAEMDLTKLIGMHVKGLRQKCKGKFSAKVGRTEKTKSKEIRRATATCAPYEGETGTPVSVALLLVLSGQGGFTVFTHEAEIGKQDEALSARDKLAIHLLATS